MTKKFLLELNENFINSDIKVDVSFYSSCCRSEHNDNCKDHQAYNEYCKQMINDKFIIKTDKEENCLHYELHKVSEFNIKI